MEISKISLCLFVQSAAGNTEEDLMNSNSDSHVTHENLSSLFKISEFQFSHLN